MRLIGLNGRAHSGKDTAFDFIQDAAPGATVRREGFADRMKMSGLAALGIPFSGAEDALEVANAIKETGCIVVNWVGPDGHTYDHELDGRFLWQCYGTEAHREIFGDDFWVDAVLPQPSNDPEGPCRIYENTLALRKRFPNADVVVITDVRYPNEADRILRLGGEVWAINADSRLGPLPADSHATEQPLPKHLVTATVPNNTTLENFQGAIYTTFDLARNRR